MSEKRNSRELASRVEIDFHRKGNRFQRLMWWSAGVCALVALCGVVIESSRGHHQIYQAGELSTSHKMFANDCAACHTDWAPAKRLFLFSGKDKFPSIDESKCRACHEASPHVTTEYATSEDGSIERSGHDVIRLAAGKDHHTGIGCAECHREHQGDVDLSAVANALCVSCHGDLEKSGHTSSSFANSVTSFEDHIEFRFAELTKDKNRKADPTSVHGAFGRMSNFPADVPGFHGSGWQDKTALAFDHAAHLGLGGVMGPEGPGAGAEFLDCASCHEPDEGKEYFKPISFEEHCRRCHELKVSSFDVALSESIAGADRRVPHESPELVRGYLMRHYKNWKVGSTAVLTPEQEEALRARVVGSEDRLMPGKSDEQRAEISRRDGFRPEQLTNCGLCHQVAKNADSEWEVTAPQIPDRWLPHSHFNHDPHRIVNCQQCHEGVRPDANGNGGSRLTGDVLMPTKEVCMKCHSEQGKPASFISARSNCVECHKYHKRDHEPLHQDQTIDKLLGLK